MTLQEKCTTGDLGFEISKPPTIPIAQSTPTPLVLTEKPVSPQHCTPAAVLLAALLSYQDGLIAQEPVSPYKPFLLSVALVPVFYLSWQQNSN